MSIKLHEPLSPGKDLIFQIKWNIKENGQCSDMDLDFNGVVFNAEKVEKNEFMDRCSDFIGR